MLGKAFTLWPDFSLWDGRGLFPLFGVAMLRFEAAYTRLYWLRLSRGFSGIGVTVLVLWMTRFYARVKEKYGKF